MTSTPLQAAFERQIGWCREPSPFTARVLSRTLAWLPQAPDARVALEAAAADPLAGAVPLRWAAALHHLALRGLEPWASAWPRGDDGAIDAAIAQAWATQRSSVLAALGNAPQTNEVQRSAMLLPGLLHVAAATGQPLALLEIGASAGLNLWPERHRYDYGAWRWGAADAPLALQAGWQGPVPPAAPLRVLQRAGCDAQPIDITRPDEALRLASFVWADQHDRLARLAAARGLAARWMAEEGVAVQALPAARFVEAQLAEPRPGVTTVLMHTIVWQYIGPDEQRRITAALRRAGEAGASLAWLRFEPPAPERTPELRCTLWPGGEDRCLATAHAHVQHIAWAAA